MKLSDEAEMGSPWQEPEMLSSIKRQAGTQYPTIRMNFTCMQTNIHELLAMVDFAADHSAESLHVRHLVAYGDRIVLSCGNGYRELFNVEADQARNARFRAMICSFGSGF
jgi:hypothetical protein